jgi:hypothetical protein
MEKKTMIIGLVALVVIGGALYLHNKKKGKVSSADGDDEESNYTGKPRLGTVRNVPTVKWHTVYDPNPRCVGQNGLYYNQACTKGQANML